MATNDKPLLGPCDSYQLEPFQYEWAWAMARAQENNNWAPEEIAVASDVADWKSPDTDPKHRHLFQSVMAQLTTFDIERGDDAAETFLSVFQPAEVRHFLKRLVWEEALHTRSYRYVIENLGIPLTIYDLWKEVPAMRARVEMAQAISKDIELLVAVRRYFDQEPDDTDRRAILRSLVFWFLIFEGVWFWVSLLGPVQQLARLGVFRGGAEQFQYIARDEQTHIGFGIALIREYMAQYPESVTEDNVARILDDTRQALTLEGAHVATAVNGQQAVQRLGAAPTGYDAVLMDLQMPVMDGLTAIRTIRARERVQGLARTPIIAVSANAMTHHVEEALKAGADAHVSKPIDPGALLTQLMTLCGDEEPAAQQALGL